MLLFFFLQQLKLEPDEIVKPDKDDFIFIKSRHTEEFLFEFYKYYEAEKKAGRNIFMKKEEIKAEDQQVDGEHRHKRMKCDEKGKQEDESDSECYVLIEEDNDPGFEVVIEE